MIGSQRCSQIGGGEFGDEGCCSSPHPPTSDSELKKKSMLDVLSGTIVMLPKPGAYD
jgi:hypothetical protein